MIPIPGYFGPGSIKTPPFPFPNRISDGGGSVVSGGLLSGLYGTFALSRADSTGFRIFVSGIPILPATPPPGNGRSTAWASGAIIARSTQSGFCTCYSWDQATLTLGDPPQDVSGVLGNGCAVFDPTERFVAIWGGNSSGRFQIRQFSGATVGPAISGPGSGILGTSQVALRTVAWHPSGNFVVVGTTVAPFLFGYLWNSGYVGNAYICNSGEFQNSPRDIEFSPLGDFIAVAHAASPSGNVSVILFNSGFISGSTLVISGAYPSASATVVKWNQSGTILAAVEAVVGASGNPIKLWPFVSGSFGIPLGITSGPLTFSGLTDSLPKDLSWNSTETLFLTPVSGTPFGTVWTGSGLGETLSAIQSGEFTWLNISVRSG